VQSPPSAGTFAVPAGSRKRKAVDTPKKRKVTKVVDHDEQKRRNVVNAARRRAKLASYEQMYHEVYPVLRAENNSLREENRRLLEYIHHLQTLTNPNQPSLQNSVSA
jgi:hypothetical protein